MLGSAVAVQAVVARTQQLVIAVVGVVAYPQGFEFCCLVQHRRGLEGTGLMYGGGRRPGHPGPEPEGLAAELFRIGVQFTDGTKATNVGGMGYRPPPGTDEEPPRAVMMPMGVEEAATAGDSDCGSGPFPRLAGCPSWLSGRRRASN